MCLYMDHVHLSLAQLPILHLVAPPLNRALMNYGLASALSMELYSHPTMFNMIAPLLIWSVLLSVMAMKEIFMGHLQPQLIIVDLLGLRCPPPWPDSSPPLTSSLVALCSHPSLTCFLVVSGLFLQFSHSPL
jgi:hypothetical protein